MARLDFRGRRRSPNRSLLLLAVGAMAGLALGVVLAERTGGVKGLKDRARRLRRDQREQPQVEGLDLTHVDADDRALARHEAEGAVPDEVVEPHHTDAEELEGRVLEAFHNDLTLRGRQIDIGAIDDGVIELTGWVHSDAEVKYAVTLARGVPDVHEVMDSLTVRGAGRPR